jgi:hypothetical protein
MSKLLPKVTIRLEYVWGALAANIIGWIFNQTKGAYVFAPIYIPLLTILAVIVLVWLGVLTYVGISWAVELICRLFKKKEPERRGVKEMTFR